MSKTQRILITPLNWGLGHATRCIPIIDALLSAGQEVILASDGRALSLLKKEYPNLKIFELPGYEIRYEGSGMIWNIAKQLPKISRAILKERKAVKKIVEKEKIDVIISDNRYGCRNKQCKNIFITHQVNIAIPNRSLEIITNKINHHLINLFDECWIPDFEGENSLAGKLSNNNKDHQFIGPLSRFNRKELKKEYDLIAVLSGPEPQRSILETKLIEQLKALDFKSLIVQGKTEKLESFEISDQLKTVSYLTSEDLNEAILKSEIIIARSGYSTIMDLVALGKKAILIPTPGQTEQEYLAERLMDQQLFYHQSQNTFDLKNALKESSKYPGFNHSKSSQYSLSTILKKNLEI